MELSVLCCIAGPGTAGDRDGLCPPENGTRGALPRVLHPGVGGVLCPGALPPLPGPLHPRQPRQQEGTHRVARETTRSTSLLGSML